MRHLDHRSDFELGLRLLDKRGDVMGWPEGDFEVELRTVGSARFRASFRGGKGEHLRREADRVVIVADSHGLPPGELLARVVLEIEDDDFEDGRLRLVHESATGVYLGSGLDCGCGCGGRFDADVELPLVKLRLSDMSEEDRAELLRPAVTVVEEIRQEVSDFIEDVDRRMDELRVLRVEVESDRGAVILNGQGDRVLRARVWLGNDEITDRLGAGAFRWHRKSDREADDRVWDELHRGVGNMIRVSASEIDSWARYECSVEI